MAEEDALAIYTFYLHESLDAIARFEIEVLEAPERAIAHGQALLEKRPHYAAVTVAHGDVELARLHRPAA